MPDTPATAALHDGATLLQQAGARLAALSTRVDEQFGALVGRLDSLPPAAVFDPFGAALFGSAAAGASGVAPADGAVPPRRRRGVAVQARPPATSSAGAPFALDIDRRSNGGPTRSLVGLLPDGSAIAPVVAGIGTVVSTVLSPSLGAVVSGALARAATQGASRRPAPAGRRPLPPASAEAATAADAVAALVANLVRSAAPELVPTTAPGQAARAATVLPALSILEDQLGAIAGATASALAAAGATPVAGAATNVSARPPTVLAALSVPRSAAARAPSRLLPGPGDPAAEAAGSDAAADAPSPAQGSRRAPAAGAGSPDDDVIAEINRLLVDQAWMRGVDLR